MMLRQHHNHVSSTPKQQRVAICNQTSISKYLSVRQWLPFSTTRQANSWMMYQSLHSDFEEQLRLSARYAILILILTLVLRIRKDVLYAFSVPALYAAGCDTI